MIEHPASAGPSELQDGEVLTIGVRPSSSVPFVSAGALSSAAPVAVTPAPSSAAASCSIGYPAAVVQSIWFAVFKPDHFPELVQCEVDFPAGVSEAAEMLALARDRVTSSLYPHLIAADPQPCLEFGCFLGRPDWARDKIQVLVDSRPWDGRLFTIILDPWLQWGSFLLQGGFGTHRVPVVYIKDAPVPPGRPLMLADGALVTVLPSQCGPPATLPLAVMLQHAHMWADAIPALFPHDSSRFCLLTDGVPLFFTVDRERIRNSEDFRVAAGIALGYREHNTTCKPSVPRIQDCSILGRPCTSVVIATERIRRVRVPSGRVFPTQHAVFLDLRPLLRGFDWRIFNDGCVPLSEFEADFRDGLPDGFRVCTHGGQSAWHNDTPLLYAAHCSVLTVEYSRRPTSEDADAEAAGEGSSSGGSSDDSSSSDPGPGPPGRAVRSRSPRGHNARNRKPPTPSGDAFRAAVFASVVTTGVATEPLSQLGDSSLAISAHVPVLVALLASAAVLCFLLKWLAEPEVSSDYMRSALAVLRYMAPRMGQQWRYLPADDAAYVISDTPSQSGDEQEDDVCWVHFGVLVPGFKREDVLVALRFPAALEEAFSAVQDARSPARAAAFPDLVPAHPQPRTGAGVLLGLAAWQHHVCMICVGTSQLDRRLFSAVAPAYATRVELLTLAGVSPRLGVDVFVGDADRPAEDGPIFHLVSGLTVVFSPPAAPRVSSFSLGQLLASRFSWTADSPLPMQRSPDAYCLVFDIENIHFLQDPRAPSEYKRQIAACVGLPSDRVTLFPAAPRVMDVEVDGLACRTALAIADRRDLCTASCLSVLVDMRDLGAGWRTWLASRGHIFCPELLRDLQRFAPVGWVAVVDGVTPNHRHLAVRSGQVLVARTVRDSSTLWVAAAGSAPLLSLPSQLVCTPPMGRLPLDIRLQPCLVPSSAPLSLREPSRVRRMRMPWMQILSGIVVLPKTPRRCPQSTSLRPFWSLCKRSLRRLLQFGSLLGRTGTRPSRLYPLGVCPCRDCGSRASFRSTTDLCRLCSAYGCSDVAFDGGMCGFRHQVGQRAHFLALCGVPAHCCGYAAPGPAARYFAGPLLRWRDSMATRPG